MGCFSPKPMQLQHHVHPAEASFLPECIHIPTGTGETLSVRVLGDPDVQFSRQSTVADSVGVHEDLPTLIEILTAHGYITGITNKFHLSPPGSFLFSTATQVEMQMPIKRLLNS